MLFDNFILTWVSMAALVALYLASADTFNNAEYLSTILNYTNGNEKACHDFHNYACGSWKSYHENDQFRDLTELTDSLIGDKYLKLMEKIEQRFSELDTNAVIDVESFEFKALSLYKSCQNRDKNFYKTYLKYVRPSKDLEWPIHVNASSTWPHEKFNWLETFAHLRHYGLNGVLIDHDIRMDNENGTMEVIALSKPNIQKKKLPNYADTRIYLISFGMEHDKALRFAVKLKSFERSLFKLDKVEDTTGRVRLTVEDLEEGLSALPWDRYFETILGQKVDKDYEIEMTNFLYFAELVELMNKTDPELVCNYMMYQFMANIWDNLNLNNDNVSCLKDVRSKMHLAMNLLYAEEFLTTKFDLYTSEVHKIFEALRSEFLVKLKQNNLHLTDQEIDTLILKLNKITINIGSLPINADKRKFVSDYYQDISVNTSDYVQNHLNFMKFSTKDKHLKAIKPNQGIDPNEYLYTYNRERALRASPYFSGRYHVIVIPFAHILEPLFHINMHDVFKMGLFGFTLAHELTHAFDPNTISYDSFGIRREVNYNITGNENYNAGVECIKKYGANNINERVADILGIRLAYDTMFRSNTTIFERSQPSFTEIPIEKLFFLSTAQFFCNKIKKNLFVDHDSDDERLRQMVQNFLPFGEAFGCQQGKDVMHPMQTCRLW